jgi:uncharacterized protein (TIGR02246 family)
MITFETARSLAARLEEAWNAGDGVAFGAPFTADADFVTVRGELHQGREAIARGHQGIFDSIYAGSRVEYTVVDTRTVRGGVGIAHLGAVLKVPAGPLAGDHRALATVVIVSGENGPELTAFHNTLIG